MKNVIIFNNRSLHLYDFKELKKNYSLRICAVVFNESFQLLSSELKESLDYIYVLPDPISNKQNFPSFPLDSLFPIVEENLIKFKNTWIVAAEELNTLNAAYLREKYNLPGSSSSLILNYRNKVLQKTILKKENIRVPKFIPVKNQLNNIGKKNIYDTLSHILKIPFILKPIDMGGTIGVKSIHNYREFCEYLVKFTSFPNLIGEEFIKEKTVSL